MRASRRPGEIVLLFAAGTDAEWFEEELRAVGLPTYRAAGRNYFGQQQVTDLLAYLRLLHNRYDDEALLTVLASPFVGVSNDALVLVRAEAQRQPVFRALERPLPADLSEGDRRLLLAFKQRYERLLEVAASSSLELLCERVVAEHDYDLAVLARADGRRRYANLRKLARLARSYEELRGAEIEGFVRFVEGQETVGAKESDAVSEEEGSDAVRLLTIHAAKGLEFEVVVVADAGRSRPPASDILALSDGRFGFKVAHPATGTRVSTESYQDVRAHRERAEQAERLRLYYVAMTRAKERLIVSGSVGDAADIARRDADRMGVEPARASRGGAGERRERTGGGRAWGGDRLSFASIAARLSPCRYPRPPPPSRRSPRTASWHCSRGRARRCRRPRRGCARSSRSPTRRCSACRGSRTPLFRCSNAAPTATTPSGWWACARPRGHRPQRVGGAARDRARRRRPPAPRARRSREARRTGRPRRPRTCLVPDRDRRRGRARRATRSRLLRLAVGRACRAARGRSRRASVRVRARRRPAQRSARRALALRGRRARARLQDERARGPGSGRARGGGVPRQQSVYALACFRAGAERVEVVYQFLEAPEDVVSKGFTSADAEAVEHDLGTLVRSIREGVFLPTPSAFACSGCPALDRVCAGPRL